MLLQTDRLTKQYGQQRALDELTLTVAPGEVFGLLGPNGSGKSTAIRLILGFLRPSSGRASVDGHDCWHDSVAVRQKIAYLPGELRLYENMNGRQLVTFLGRLHGAPDLERAEFLAKQFDVDLGKPLVQMSSGMKRKVALVQVLLPRAPLLILDEPTNTLDPTMRDNLLDQIREARERGQAVLFSSHVLSEVEEVCDRVGILQQGKLVHLQNMKEVGRSRAVRVRFERPTEPPTGLSGLTVRRRDGLLMELDYTGPLGDLLTWLAQQPVAELRLEPEGLGPVYHRFHGADV
jgi:ABC-2 type transport system ATP-binding protein